MQTQAPPVVAAQPAEQKKIASSLSIKTSHYIIAAVGLVVALSWNNTIKDIITIVFPLPDDNVRANLIYSVVITLILVLMIYLLPDTRSELPAETQLKINQAEMAKQIEINNAYLSNLNNSKIVIPASYGA